MVNDKLIVAVLGPLGTYTHEAAYNAFGHKAVYNEERSITDVFDVLSVKVPFGVVPQENSIFGSVVETYDKLRSSNDFFVRGEVILKVEHCLMVKNGVKLEEIRKVMSHEQALGQCRDFLAEKLPNAQLENVPSTAGAAKALLDSPPDTAAICSSICVNLFEGLEILFSSIQNERSNFTRFYILAHAQNINLDLGPCQMKALVRVFIPVGKDITSYLKLLDICATRIDHRPAVNAAIPFSSIYIIEVQSCTDDSSLNSSGSLESWTCQVQKSVKRVNEAGGEATLVGIW